MGALVMLGCRAALGNSSSGEGRSSSLEKPHSARFSSAQSPVEHSQTNELCAPGEKECSGNSVEFLPGSPRAPQKWFVL